MTQQTTGKYSTILAFDYGMSRIGLAVGQIITATANPLETLDCPNQQPDWPAISTLIETWKPDALVVGLPLHANGEESTISNQAIKFSKQLEEKFGIQVFLQDERYSSTEAEAIIRDNRQQRTKKRKTRKGDIDKLSAALILQRWLNEYQNHD